MKSLKWSDFVWFKKKARIYFSDTYFTCSEKEDVDQKVIFPLNLGKHFTLSLSKKYLDLHVTYDARNVPQRNILEIRLDKANKMIRKTQKPDDLVFIPFHSKLLKKLVLVDPYTEEFIKNAWKMDKHNIFPTSLNKTKIRSMKNKHGKILTAYDVFSRFQGILRCNHRKGGFDFIPASSITRFEEKLVDSLELKSRLTEEGLTDNLRYKLFWKRWYGFVNFLESLRLYGRSTH